jgi:hypothetical protein
MDTRARSSCSRCCCKYCTIHRRPCSAAHCVASETASASLRAKSAPSVLDPLPTTVVNGEGVSSVDSFIAGVARTGADTRNILRAQPHRRRILTPSCLPAHPGDTARVRRPARAIRRWHHLRRHACQCDLLSTNVREKKLVLNFSFLRPSGRGQSSCR